jgi:hypothetical protein
MAEKVVVELEVKSDKGVKDVQKLNKEISNTNKEIKETQDASSQMGSTLDKATGGAVTKFKNLRGALKTAVTGFKSLRVAIIGTGIGALLIAVTSLGQAFTRSEEGQNKFAKLLGVIGSVTGNLLDLLADLGEGIISVFENPKQALINFKNAIVENVQNRITSLIDTFGFLGSAIKKVFSGDFTGALEDAKKSGSSLVDSFTGVKNSIDKATESTKGFIEELKEEAKIAGQIADQRAKADKVERKLIVERAKANRDRAELLDQAAQKEKFTAQERIAFLEEAARIDEEITNKEIEAARLRLEAKQAENALTKSTKADLDEEANLKARLIDLETQRLTKQKTVSAQIVSAKREEAAELKAIEDEEKRIKEEEQKVQDEKDAERQKVLDQKEADRLKKLKEDADEEIRIAKFLAEQKKIIQEANLNNIQAGFAFLGRIAGDNKALQAAALIGESAAGIAKTIIQTQTSNAATIAQGAALAIPTGGASVALATKLVAANKISAGISIASNIAATAKGLSALKGGGSAPSPSGNPSASGGGGGAASLPPAFNVVGASDTNQLADAIGGQSQEPVRAFVVSNDVTTAQSMDRNIVDGASI